MLQFRFANRLLRIKNFFSFVADRLCRIYSREQPEWSPDGKRIVYRRTEENMLYITEVGGQVEELLVTTRLFGEYPRWSPDGTEIAFMSKKHDEEKGSRIRIINVYTREKRWLLPDGELSHTSLRGRRRVKNLPFLRKTPS